MKLFYIGVFLISLVIVWGLFIVAKIHAMKFKNFSTNIKKMISLLVIFLLSLTVLGFILIIFYDTDTVKIKDTPSKGGDFEEFY